MENRSSTRSSSIVYVTPNAVTDTVSSRGWTCEAGPSKTRPRISDGSMTSYVLSEVISSITGTIADD